MKQFALISALGAAGLILGGCAKDIEQRGNLPKPEMLAQLAPGEQTRQDVQAILGTPTTTSMFDKENWYYISSHTTQYAFYPTHELDRTIYVLSFDTRGILSTVRRYDIEDGQAIQIADRETPTKGREYGFLEQLIGSLGRPSTQAPKGP